jgi:hypothetical protein
MEGTRKKGRENGWTEYKIEKKMRDEREKKKKEEEKNMYRILCDSF